MITQDAFTTGRSLIQAIIRNMLEIRKGRWEFIEHVLFLFLGLKGRMNFLQLGRYGEWNERTYRNQFTKGFDFMELGLNIVKEVGSEEYIIAFDPTFLKKSGRKTPGIGYFYNGSQGKYEKGLEVGCLAVIDIKHNTAYHLEAVQSPAVEKHKRQEGHSLVDHYTEMIVERAPNLQKMSKILVVDGYFTKLKFVTGICSKTDLQIVGRLRDDANLLYLYRGPKRKGKGRPQKFAGKIDVQNMDHRRIKKCLEEDNISIYEGIVYSVGLKRDVKLASVDFIHADGSVESRKLFFSTDLTMSGTDILKYYRARYQIEFLFRDAKQFTGVEHCQARNANRIHFHTNISLSAVSFAKAILRKQHGRHDELVLSISDVQIELHNKLLAERIFSIYQIDPKVIKNHARYREILDFGKIAA